MKIRPGGLRARIADKLNAPEYEKSAAGQGTG
jgi:hypothetical protein